MQITNREHGARWLPLRRTFSGDTNGMADLNKDIAPVSPRRMSPKKDMAPVSPRRKAFVPVRGGVREMTIAPEELASLTAMPLTEGTRIETGIAPVSPRRMPPKKDMAPVSPRRKAAVAVRGGVREMTIAPEELADLTAMPLIEDKGLEKDVLPVFSTRGISAPVGGGDLRKMVITPEESASSPLAEGKASVRCKQTPQRPSLQKSKSTRELAIAIDERVKSDETTYMNDLMRNTMGTKQPRRSSTSELNTRKGSPLNPRCLSPKQSAASFISEDGTYSTEPESVSSVDSDRQQGEGKLVPSMKPRDFAKAIDARIKSDRNSYTNDLIRQVSRQSQSQAYRPAPLPSKSMGRPSNLTSIPSFESLESLEQASEEEMIQLALERSTTELDLGSSFAACSLSTPSSLMRTHSNDKSLGEGSLVILDERSAARLAEIEEENKMLDLAIQQSLEEERQKASRTEAVSKFARMEQEMLDLAMERSMADVGFDHYSSHR